MIDIVANKDCCGCGACAFVCPKSAIAMTADEEGFLRPRMDGDKCVDCGRCRRVCPVLRGGAPRRPLKLIVGWSKSPEMRHEGSSGGFFALLASEILAAGGVVFGAAFDEHWELRHVGAETPGELKRLCGSKYLQSCCRDSFAPVREALECGRTVLFCGTPCQIAALHILLPEALRDHLLSVEIVCHGVASPLAWKKYLAWTLKKLGAGTGDLEEFSFRDKDNCGYFNYCTSLKLAGREQRVYIASGQDSYMHAFRDISLRPSCYRCGFKELRSGSDFTVGDVWGMKNALPEEERDAGCSLVLINTPRAERVFEKIRSGFHEIEQQVLNWRSLRRLNPMLFYPVRKYRRRREFFHALPETEDFDALVGRLYLRRTPSEAVRDLLRRVLIKFRLTDY